MQAHREGRLSAADLLYRQAAEGQPANAQLLRLHGVLARERGELAAAESRLLRAVGLAPADPRAACELGVTRMVSGELDAAMQDLRRALACDPGYLPAHANLGALLQYRGHVLEAIAHYELVLAAEPADAESRCNLVRALSDAGRLEQALACCSDGLAIAPWHPLLLAARGTVLCDAGRFGDALPWLRAATERRIDDDTIWVTLAHAHQMLDDPASAIDALGQALRANPDSGRATASLVNLLAGTGHRAQALAMAESFLARHPGERQVLSVLDHVLRDLGREAEALALFDPARMLRVVDLRPPAGHGDMAAFNAELCRAIVDDPSLVTAPASKSTRGGGQTGELDRHRHEALQSWWQLVGEAVEDMLAALSAAFPAGHPLMAPAAPRWALRAWGTVLAAGGYQDPHIHPLGWISGVYYAAVPPGMSAGAADAGCLEFGARPRQLLAATAPSIHRIEPRPGRLVLFPSWVWHRTLPFAAAGQRVSLAFDVMPRREWRGAAPAA